MQLGASYMIEYTFCKIAKMKGKKLSSCFVTSTGCKLVVEPIHVSEGSTNHEQDLNLRGRTHKISRTAIIQVLRLNHSAIMPEMTI